MKMNTVEKTSICRLLNTVVYDPEKMPYSTDETFVVYLKLCPHLMH